MRPHGSQASSFVEGTAAALTGLAALTLAFFPLVIPFVALAVVAVIPLLVVALAIGLAAAVVAAPLLLGRWLWRRSRGRLSRERTEGELRPPSPVGA
jgi:hypothetical protein